MSNWLFSSSKGIHNTDKLFAKIYNVFYCSKKAEPPPVGDEADEAGRLKVDWFQALKNEDLAKVNELLSKGINVNMADELGWTALHMAAWNGLTQICSALLQHSCQVDAGGTGGSTPLTLAAQTGHSAVVQLLIKAGCNVRVVANLGDSEDVTALHLAAQNGHKDIVNQLIKAGATVNAHMKVREVTGVTPLHLAVEAGHLDIMDILIEAGCDVHSTTQASSDSLC